MKLLEDIDESYKQISDTYEHFIAETSPTIGINLTHRSYFCIFLILIFTSQSRALPVPQINYRHLQQPSLPFSIHRLQLTSGSTPPMLIDKPYRPHPILSYSNGVIEQNNVNIPQLFKRERYRRTMIDRLFSQFDEDVDGQLSKDELYSLSLRLNLFPRFHHFLKKASPN